RRNSSRRRCDRRCGAPRRRARYPRAAACYPRAAACYPRAAACYPRARLLPARRPGHAGDDRLAAQRQIEAACHDDSDEPAQIRAAEELGGDRPLQRADEPVFHRPARDQAGDERDDPGPVDVAEGALPRLAIELLDVDLTAALDEEVRE